MNRIKTKFITRKITGRNLTHIARCRALAWLAATVLLGATVAVVAGPPFATDDPGPVDYQHWEFYVESFNTKSSGGWSGTMPNLTLNYGVISNVQLHAVLPVAAYNAPSEGSTHIGYGDTQLGVKYRFLQETADWPQLGIYPSVNIPTGDAGKGLGNHYAQVFLPLWMQKSWGSWTAYGGGGYGINDGPGNQNWGYVGAVLQRQVLKNLFLGAEVYHQTAQQIGGRNNTAFNVGAGIDLSKRHHLFISAGRSIDGPVDFQFYVGYQFTFDNSFFRFLSKAGH
jgi:hypothetical protein